MVGRPTPGRPSGLTLTPLDDMGVSTDDADPSPAPGWKAHSGTPFPPAAVHPASPAATWPAVLCCRAGGISKEASMITRAGTVSSLRRTAPAPARVAPPGTTR